MEVAIRPAVASDAPFLSQMFVEAAFWKPEDPRPTIDDIRRQHALAHYSEGWPLPGDMGVIAEADRPLGAAWLRFFPSSDPGDGFVADGTPELCIAIVPEWRGRGLGARLLAALIAEARAAGLSAVSLSVESDNAARHLYARMGFQEVREVDGDLTMLLTL